MLFSARQSRLILAGNKIGNYLGVCILAHFMSSVVNDTGMKPDIILRTFRLAEEVSIIEVTRLLLCYNCQPSYHNPVTVSFVDAYTFTIDAGTCNWYTPYEGSQSDSPEVGVI